MIGTAKAAAASNISPPVVYSSFLTPSFLSVNSQNGGASSPLMTVNVTGGVGPFTYLWEALNKEVTINQPTSENSSFSASGYNTEVESNITVTVTDTGNGDAESISNSSVSFLFGNIN